MLQAGKALKPFTEVSNNQEFMECADVANACTLRINIKIFKKPIYFLNFICRILLLVRKKGEESKIDHNFQNPPNSQTRALSSV